MPGEEGLRSNGTLSFILRYFPSLRFPTTSMGILPIEIFLRASALRRILFHLGCIAVQERSESTMQLKRSRSSIDPLAQILDKVEK